MKDKNPFPVLKQETVYKNKWSSIQRTLIKKGSIKKEIFTTNFGRRSAVILFKEGKVLLTKQYRLLLKGYSWEIPGGKVEDSETFKEGASRECREETGYRCETLSLLIKFEPGLETLSNPTKIYLCKNFKKIKSQKEYETVKSKWFRIQEIKEMYKDGFFLDSLTIIGLQALLLKGS